MNRYLSQKATPWVSISVLAGGLLTACILFFLVRIENNIEVLARPTLEEFIGERS